MPAILLRNISGHAPDKMEVSRGPWRPNARRKTGYQDNDLLHVRMPLRHPCAYARWGSPIHRRQPGPPAQSGCDLREGVLRDHEAVLTCSPDATPDAKARGRTGYRAVRA